MTHGHNGSLIRSHAAYRAAPISLKHTFFAVVLVVMQRESVVTRTLVTADGVLTDVLTPAVVRCAFIFICIDNRTPQALGTAAQSPNILVIFVY